MANDKSKNVKIRLELLQLLEKRTGSNKNPGDTLLAIYKEYEYLETVARRVTGAKEDEPINISEAIEKFFVNTNDELAQLRKSHDDFRIMLQGLQLFFTKVKQ